MTQSDYIQHFESWVNDADGWNRFSRDYLGVNLDAQQDQALHLIRHNSRVAIASGTSRGKDYLMAVAAVCFLYLTPEWDESGKMVSNTKVALTGPTGRQIGNIIRPEIFRIFKNAPYLPGRLVGNDIRFHQYEEWFLTGFKADDTNTEAWSGFHAANVMFGITEATGIKENVFDAVEGNLQGNSRLVLVFNPNINHGYAANAFKSGHFKTMRLNSLEAPNVKAKKIIHPGQVDCGWVEDKLNRWCSVIRPEQFRHEEGDFEHEGTMYRPNDEFRKKILGLFPKVSEGVLVPREWIELANQRWKQHQGQGWGINAPLRLGADVAGMGRDSSCECPRFGDWVEGFYMHQSNGQANHMEFTGILLNRLKKHSDEFTGKFGQVFIDTIGEGAGCYSRFVELEKEQGMAWLKGKVHSCKFSEKAADEAGRPLNDTTGVFEFLNMRAYLYWAVRDWLDPYQGSKAMLPPNDALALQLTEMKWKFMSDGSRIRIEDKEELKKRIKKSPDEADALANTFWPVPDIVITNVKKKNPANFFLR